jgi:pSer/pThr/pTyr-binding forkhead associated (FHA) protein
MIVCPNCKHKELPGAIFCRQCGAQLFGEELPTIQFRTTDRRLSDELKQAKQRTPTDETPLPHVPLMLRFFQEGLSVPIPGNIELIIGRSGEGQSVVPDIDLTAYHAREAGVSRLHAALRVVDDQVTIIDLGSSNGTMINDRKIQAHHPHNLNDGDLVSLGKLKFKVVIPRKSSGGI